MSTHPDLAELEQHRTQLHTDLAAVEDFRPGTLSVVMRRCGKPNCACADPAHPGHGPQHILTKKVHGKTVSVHLTPGPELEKVRAEVGNYTRFKQIVGELVQVSEAICQDRPISPLAADDHDGGGQAGGDGPGAPGPERGGSTRRSRKRSPPR